MRNRIDEAQELKLLWDAVLEAFKHHAEKDHDDSKASSKSGR